MVESFALCIVTRIIFTNDVVLHLGPVSEMLKSRNMARRTVAYHHEWQCFSVDKDGAG